MSPKRAEIISLRLSAPPQRQQAPCRRRARRPTRSVRAACRSGARVTGRRRRRKQCRRSRRAPQARKALREAVADMRPERAVECVEAAGMIGVLERRHLLEQDRDGCGSRPGRIGSGRA